MNKKLKGYLIDLRKGTAEVVEFVDELNNLYELTNCDMIEIPMYKVGRFTYDVVCDEEGLLKDRKIFTAWTKEGLPRLCGNLLFCNHDNCGNLASLSDEQIEELKKYTNKRCYVDYETELNYCCIEGIEYC